MLSVELCESASAFKFEILADFWSILAILAGTKTFKVAYCVRRTTSKIILIPTIDKGIVE